MTSEQRDILKALCERIVKEKDPNTLTKLARELCQWLFQFMPKRKLV